MIMMRSPTPSSSSSSSNNKSKMMMMKKGLWTAEEDEILSNYVTQHGEGGWRTLPHKAGLQRCGKSCRLRWMNYLRPQLKRSPISLDEEDLILRLHRLLGNRWALIAGRIPGRTDNEIKNYWNTHLSKKLINQGIDPRNHKPLFNHSNHQPTLIHNYNTNTQPHHHLTLINPTNHGAHQQLMTNQVVVSGDIDDDIMGGVVHEQDSFSFFLDSLLNNNCDNIIDTTTTTSLQQFDHRSTTGYVSASTRFLF